MNTLKKKIFQVVEKQLAIKDFERWLYVREDLVDRMDEDLIFELFSFNYNQRGVDYEFKKSFLAYYDPNEFLNWKIIANLEDLSKGCSDPERILSDFIDLGYEDFYYLADLGYNLYQLENCKYFGWNREKLLDDIQFDAANLLAGIQHWISTTSDCNLINYKSVKMRDYYLKSNRYQPEIREEPKYWWKFWK